MYDDFQQQEDFWRNVATMALCHEDKIQVHSVFLALLTLIILLYQWNKLAVTFFKLFYSKGLL